MAAPSDHTEASAVTRWISAINDRLRGYDVFISYARADAETYASRLTEVLRSKGLRVFLDQSEIRAGVRLPTTLETAIRRSSALVLIGSDAAKSSRWVKNEIAHAQAVGREIVPLDIGGAIAQNAEAFGMSHEVVRIEESSTNLALGPSEEVISGLVHCFTFQWQASKRRRRMGVAVTAVLFSALAAYIAVIDRGATVPGATAVRTWMDRYELEFVRFVPADRDILKHATELRNQLAAYLPTAEVVATSSAKGLDYEDSIEIYAQLVSALLRSRESRTQGLRLMPSLIVKVRSEYIKHDVSAPVIAAAWKPWRKLPEKDVPLGWKPWTKAPYTTYGPTLWLLQAVALCGREGCGMDPREKQSIIHMAQETCALLHPGLEEGWNVFPLQEDPRAHSTYTTALALQTLLELRTAKLPWKNSESLRDELIGSAVRWLLTNFEPARNGWRADPTTVGEAYEGLTLQIYSLLLRSLREAGTTISGPVRDAMYVAARSWEERNDFSQVAPERWGYNRRFINAQGELVDDGYTLAFAKHPWAIAFASEWSGYLRRTNAPNEQITQARRTLANVVVNHGQKGFDAATENKRETFVASEFLYALGSVSPEIVGNER